MASMFSKILGRLTGGPAAESAEGGTPGEAIEYNGYTIRPAARRQGSQWITAGVITKQFDDGPKEHQFIRADSYMTKEDADTCAVGKAKRIVDEQGDRMFQERS